MIKNVFEITDLLDQTDGYEALKQMFDGKTGDFRLFKTNQSDYGEVFLYFQHEQFPNFRLVFKHVDFMNVRRHTILTDVSHGVGELLTYSRWVKELPVFRNYLEDFQLVLPECPEKFAFVEKSFFLRSGSVHMELSISLNPPSSTPSGDGDFVWRNKLSVLVNLSDQYIKMENSWFDDGFKHSELITNAFLTTPPTESMDEINAKMSEAVYQTIRNNVVNSLLKGNKLPSVQSEEMLLNNVLRKRFNTHENALFTCRTHQSTDEADERDGKPLTLKMEGWLGRERVCMRFLDDTPFEILCAAVNKRFIQQFFNGFYVSCAGHLSYLEWKARQKAQEGRTESQ